MCQEGPKKQPIQRAVEIRVWTSLLVLNGCHTFVFGEQLWQDDFHYANDSFCEGDTALYAIYNASGEAMELVSLEKYDMERLEKK